MVVKKFYGKTTRDALRQVREELGADALILSNRPTQGGGVEIMAVADADVAALATTLNPAPSPSRHPPRNAPGPIAPSRPAPAAQASASPLGRAVNRTYAMPVEPLDSAPPPQPRQPEPPPLRAEIPPAPRTQRVEPTFHDDPPPRPRQPEAPPRPAPAAPEAPRSERPTASAAPSAELRQIGDEIKQLRSLLQSQLAGFAWAEMGHTSPNRLELFRQLLAAGLSGTLIRQLIDKMPAQYDGDVALKWARSALAHNLKCADADRELLQHGGIFALVGPTGVGKTTTVAKLAARATMQFGAQNVALITTDSYRVGAQDQLRIYGKILGIPVYAVQNQGELDLTLSDLANRHIVLVDTVGMSQRDARVTMQTDMFANCTRPVERILLIAANADGHTLEDVVKNYRGPGLAGAIVSKLDEAMTVGPALDVLIRNRMRLFYVTNGQRVPEDLHMASASYLVDRILKAPQEQSPFALAADELPLMQAAQAGWL